MHATALHVSADPAAAAACSAQPAMLTTAWQDAIALLLQASSCAERVAAAVLAMPAAPFAAGPVLLGAVAGGCSCSQHDMVDHVSVGLVALLPMIVCAVRQLQVFMLFEDSHLHRTTIHLQTL